MTARQERSDLQEAARQSGGDARTKMKTAPRVPIQRQQIEREAKWTKGRDRGAMRSADDAGERDRADETE
jgi:hypothetical protein